MLQPRPSPQDGNPQRRNGLIDVGRLLEDSGIGHFEEPCPYWHPDGFTFAAGGVRAGPASAPP